MAKKTQQSEEVIKRYITVSNLIKQLTAERSELQAEIKENMKDGVLETAAGTAVLEQRHSYTWKLDDIRAFFGMKWTKFVKVDTELVKERAKTVPELYKLAEDKVTEAVTIKP